MARARYRSAGMRNLFTPANAYRAISAGIKTYNQIRKRPNSGGSNTNTKRRRVTDGIGVTSQFDKTLIYRKKKMPYRKKKSWVNFSRKVRAVLEKEQGTKTVLYNTSISEQNAVGQQAILTIGMYTSAGLVDVPAGNYCGLRDLLVMVANDPMDLTGKVKCKSAVLDVTFTADPQNEVATELDVYELWFNGKECNYTSVNGIFAQAAANTGTISGAGTQLTIVDRGVTPFELPNAFSIGHFSIAKKMKYFLGSGTSCTYQIRDPRTHIFTKSDIGDDVGLSPSKKCCRILYAIFKPVIGGAYQNRVYAGCTRKYSYAITEQTADKDNLL